MQDVCAPKVGSGQKGADLDDIRRLLGHADLRMTIRYAHLLPEHLEATASRLDGVLTLPAPPAISEMAIENRGLS